MQPGYYLQKIYNRRWTRILLHLLFWLFYFGAQVHLGSIQLDHASERITQLSSLKNTIAVILVYYPLVYLIVPRLWLKKKYLAGIVSVAALVVAYAFIDYVLELMLIVSCASCMAELEQKASWYFHFMHHDPVSILTARILSLGIVYQLFLFLSLPVFIKTTLSYLNEYIQKIKLQTENVQLEFNFLKAQVHPHFLFNTLNNIYALILQDKKDESAETVACLSSFMRYTLYECDNATNPVLKEVALLKDFIALEQIRLNNTTVNFTYDTDSELYQLPPLLFMPVVENAFKFCGSGNQGNSFIFIHLEIKNHQLALSISNTSEPRLNNTASGGIGLNNLRKRLAQYYPGSRHRVVIQHNDDVYKMHIHINLQQV